MESICSDCKKELQHGDWPFCNGTGEHGSVFEVNAQRFDPVVVFKSADGRVRTPGRSDAPTPEGFARVELKTVREIRAFERQMNMSEHSKHEASREKDSRACEAARTQLRGELRMAMQGMSNEGRDFARLAMERTNNRKKERFDAGFRVEAFS